MDSTLASPPSGGMTPRQRFTATALGVLAGTIASAGTIAVTAAGFALSFDAIRDVGAAAHIRPSLTWMLPVCVDGAMAVAAVCAVVLRRMGRANVYPWSVVVVGAGISIAANALHAYQEGGAVPLPVEWAMAASSVPALLLALSVHLVVILAEAVRQSGQPAAVTIPASGNAVRATQRPRQPATPPRPRATSRSTSTADRVARVAARQPDLTKAQVAAKLGVSERTVQRAWPTTPELAPSSNSQQHGDVPELAEVAS